MQTARDTVAESFEQAVKDAKKEQTELGEVIISSRDPSFLRLDSERTEYYANVPQQYSFTRKGGPAFFPIEDLVTKKSRTLLNYGYDKSQYAIYPDPRWDRYYIPYYILPKIPGEVSLKKSQNLARKGDVIAMASLGYYYYERGNKSLAYRYFELADSASTSYAIANAIANCITNDPVERRRYHRLSIERGGLPSIKTIISKDKNIGYVHAMIALAYHDQVRLTSTDKFPNRDTWESYLGEKAIPKFQRLFKKIKQGKSKKNKEAYAELMEVLKTYPKAQVERISKMLYGDSESDLLFREIQDSLIQDIKANNANKMATYHKDYFENSSADDLISKKAAESVATKDADKFIQFMMGRISNISKRAFKNRSEFIKYINQIWEPKNEIDKRAYHVVIGSLRELSKGEVEQISKLLYEGDSQRLFTEIQNNAVLVDIKEACLKIRNDPTAESKEKDNLSKRYHKDYFPGNDPVEYITNQMRQFSQEFNKQEEKLKKTVEAQEKKLEESLMELKHKTYGEMHDLLEKIGLAHRADLTRGTFNDAEQGYLDSVFTKPLPTSQKEREIVLQLRAFTNVAEALDIECRSPNIKPSAPPLSALSSQGLYPTLDSVPIPLAQPVQSTTTQSNAVPRENASWAEKTQYIQSVIKQATNSILQEKSKDDSSKYSAFLDFSKKALAVIAVALTGVGAVKMLHSHIRYGTHAFWSAEKKAKAAVKKATADFKLESRKIIPKPQKR